MIEFLGPELAARLRRRHARPMRRRLVLDGRHFTNGTFSDGLLTVTIQGRRTRSAGLPDTLQWRANRPVTAISIRRGVEGDVATWIGPATSGTATGPAAADGTGVASVTFFYVTTRDELARRRRRHFAMQPRAFPAPAPVVREGPVAPSRLLQMALSVGRQSA